MLADLSVASKGDYLFSSAPGTSLNPTGDSRVEGNMGACNSYAAVKELQRGGVEALVFAFVFVHNKHLCRNVNFRPKPVSCGN